MLKILALPLLLAVILWIAIAVQLQGDVMFQLYLGEYQSIAGPLFMIFVFLVAINLTLIWPVIVWHRFVLLETPVGWVNKIKIASIFRYFFTYIGIMLLVLIPSMIVIFSVTSVVDGQTPGFAGLTNFVVSPIIAWIVYRLTPVLPGIALEKEENGILSAWRATESGSGALFVLGLIFGLIGFVQSMISFVLPETLATIVSVLISVFILLLQVSVATTIYGHYVEDRPI
ncbi:hypothetical protein GFB49_07180 [Epibacterium sp. SM1979]|uniref:Uncharacterized protein n=1 Tax=Tritonibacter litoralis TaxID=2662264 RepID=A0A843YGH0_9RHOB|nr:hypothetical protein [Tritonibacter litoralis]MQQ08229.1 hypothetical protein [Tritonibacter litoralis]